MTTLRARLASWYITRQARKTLGMSRAEWRRTMPKPFPKWMAIFFALPVAWGAYKAGDMTTAIATLLGALGLTTTHSLNGTGGKPQ